MFSSFLHQHLIFGGCRKAKEEEERIKKATEELKKERAEKGEAVDDDDEDDVNDRHVKRSKVFFYTRLSKK